MKYKCKLIVKDRMTFDGTFQIFIKYKPINSKIFYKTFSLVDYDPNISFYTSSIESQLDFFNNLSMEEIKKMLIQDILRIRDNKIEEKKEDDFLQKKIDVAKEKQVKFTIEV